MDAKLAVAVEKVWRHFKFSETVGSNVHVLVEDLASLGRADLPGAEVTAGRIGLGHIKFDPQKKRLVAEKDGVQSRRNSPLPLIAGRHNLVPGFDLFTKQAPHARLFNQWHRSFPGFGIL